MKFKGKNKQKSRADDKIDVGCSGSLECPKMFGDSSTKDSKVSGDNLPKDSKVSGDNLPESVAIIMDGNGRWAKKRLLPRKVGHREGANNIDRISEYVFARGIKYLTVFAFSTENWKRPKGEVNGLVDLFKKYLKSHRPKLIKNGIALRVVGNRDGFDGETVKLIESCENDTAIGKKGVLAICFNYGGRADIVSAVNKLVQEGRTVDEATLAKYLQTDGISDPDIVIRTGGNSRVSNFLLYQMAYSELFFTQTLWPDFSTDEFEQILQAYLQISRRFGTV